MDSWLGTLPNSKVYTDFLKPYAQQKLGISDDEANTNDQKQKDYENARQKQPTDQAMFGGFTQNQLILAGGAVLTLLIIRKL